MSDKSPDLYIKGKSAQSYCPPSAQPRAMLRRGPYEAPPGILTIVEKATRVPVPSSSSENVQHPALLIPETNSPEGSKHSPLNPLNWIRRDRHGADEEAGKS